MSIKSIYVENYKAFKEAKIDLNKLTVLLGTNSSGKSSLIKLILMLSQSLESDIQNDQLITIGSLTDLGEIENIFHNREISQDIKIEFNISTIPLKKIIKMLRDDVKDFFNMIIRERYHLFRTSKVYDEKNTFDIDSLMRSTFENKLSFEETGEMARNIIRKTKRLELSNIENNFLFSIESSNLITERTVNNLLKIVDELSKIEYINCFGYTLTYYKENLIFKDLYMKQDEKDFLRICFFNKETKRKNLNFKSDLIDCTILNQEKNSMKELRIINLELSILRDKKYYSIDYSKIFNIFTRLNYKVIRENLDEILPQNIKHVGPLRFNPKRFYLIENNDNTKLWNTSDGEKLTKILNDNKKLIGQINKWFDKFELEIDIKQIKSIIHSITVKDRGLNLDITDVGFGISQVLPVILQPYLANDNGIIIIEQPEVHIHPKMQSDLADLFVSLIKSSNKRFIIETHSEAFLKRLRRRISESEEKLSTSIESKDVSLYFVEKKKYKNKNSYSKLIPIEVSSKGMFDWPKDFRDNDIEDTIEFMKRQG